MSVNLLVSLFLFYPPGSGSSLLFQILNLSFLSHLPQYLRMLRQGSITLPHGWCLLLYCDRKLDLVIIYSHKYYKAFRWESSIGSNIQRGCFFFNSTSKQRNGETSILAKLKGLIITGTDTLVKKASLYVASRKKLLQQGSGLCCLINVYAFWPIIQEVFVGKICQDILGSLYLLCSQPGKVLPQTGASLAPSNFWISS